jgi:segregation and condensation protein A
MVVRRTLQGRPDDFFEERSEADPVLVVDVDGYEGPLDVLLVLARQQKVDLNKISILALAEQYLAFVEEARKIRLELAADYLLMAAWLAYLKSRLLLPEPTTDEEPSGVELAEALTARLQVLDAVRRAGQLLMARPRTGLDVFHRGNPEGIAATSTPVWLDTLNDVLSAYASQRQRRALARVTLTKRQVWSLADAREALQRLTGLAVDWTRLDSYLMTYAVPDDMRTSVIASSFASSLELAREGVMELRQDGAFQPIWVRARRTPADGGGHG